jgi:prefoldin beta subunit
MNSVSSSNLTIIDEEYLMGEETQIPPQLQEQLQRLQQLQQTLEAVVSQRQQLEMESMEVNRALAELEKISDDGVVYKSIGSLLVRAEKKKVVEELVERKELLATRVTVLQRQQTRADERLKELQKTIQDRLRTGLPPQG